MRSADAALQGRARGVTSSSASGGVRVRLRNSACICEGNDPLYVVDGVTVAPGTTSGANSLALIQPSDIISIDVMKRGEATARYGDAARNGVILITTQNAPVAVTEVEEAATAPFPNPVASGGLVTIPSPPKGLCTVEVTDALGRRVATLRASASPTVTTAGFAPGVYLVRLVGDTTRTVRFTVQ